MNSQPFNLTSPLLAFVCLAALTPVAARADGSIFFNGGTSKLQNDTADLLAGSNEITICAWLNAAGLGGGSEGSIVRLDEDGSALKFGHHSSPHTLNWYAGVGKWTFPFTDGVWLPVSLTYDKSTSVYPVVRVNFADVTETQANPPGSNPDVVDGYCVGNEKGQSRGWNGQIAHVQVFNRILSAAEQDACLKAPGSVPNGLRLWLPMTTASDISDRSGNAFHGTGTDLTTGSDSPVYDSLFQFGVTSETRGQIVIPNSGNRGVLGLGPETTKLIADSAVTYRFVTTANYPTTPVDSATVAGLTLDGNKISTDAFPYVGFPNMYEWSQAAVADGVEICAHHARITNCRIRGFRGNGATITRPDDSAQWGVFEQIDNCEIVQNFIGVYVTSSDQRVFQNMIANSRDAGIRIANDSGAVQTANNHVFGAYRAYENLGGDGGNHVNDYYADACRGIHLEYEANENNFTNCLVQHCTEEAAKIIGARNSFTNCRFVCAQSSPNWPNAIGIELSHDADYSRFTGCQFGVNHWSNPNEMMGTHTAARAAIYINLDPTGVAPYQTLNGVHISGIAYTVYTRTGDVLMQIVGTADGVRSMTVDMDVDFFDDANDKLLVVDADTYFRDCHLVFRGGFGGNLVPGDVFDLPTAWGAANGNSITVYDTDNGAVHTLDMNATY